MRGKVWKHPLSRSMRTNSHTFGCQNWESLSEKRWSFFSKNRYKSPTERFLVPTSASCVASTQTSVGLSPVVNIHMLSEIWDWMSSALLWHYCCILTGLERACTNPTDQGPLVWDLVSDFNIQITNLNNSKTVLQLLTQSSSTGFPQLTPSCIFIFPCSNTLAFWWQPLSGFCRTWWGGQCAGWETAPKWSAV